MRVQMAKRKKPKSSGPTTSRPSSAPLIGLKPGAPVGHSTFGVGKVASVEGDKVTVRFQTAGTKIVLESYIKPR